MHYTSEFKPNITVFYKIFGKTVHFQPILILKLGCTLRQEKIGYCSLVLPMQEKCCRLKRHTRNCFTAFISPLLYCNEFLRNIFFPSLCHFPLITRRRNNRLGKWRGSTGTFHPCVSLLWAVISCCHKPWLAVDGYLALNSCCCGAHSGQQMALFLPIAADKGMHRFNTLKTEIRIPFELAVSDVVKHVRNIAPFGMWCQEKATFITPLAPFVCFLPVVNP